MSCFHACRLGCTFLDASSSLAYRRCFYTEICLVCWIYTQIVYEVFLGMPDGLSRRKFLACLSSICPYYVDLSRMFVFTLGMFMSWFPWEHTCFPGCIMWRHKFLACLSSTCPYVDLSSGLHVMTQVSCLLIVDMFHTLLTLSCIACVCFYTLSVHVVFA